MQTDILVVEDDKKVQSSIKEILEIENYNVITCDNANEAIVELQKKLPSLIISDVMMPGLSGFDLLAELKKNPVYFSIPFIFLTARADFADIRKGMNIGSDDYLVKPFRAKDLLNSVRIRLEKKRLYDDKIARVSENLSSHVPHELRTPLVTIIGYPDILTDYYDDFSDEEKLDMIKSIKASGLKLQETVEKFIVLSDLQNTFFLERNNKEVVVGNNIEALIMEIGSLMADKFDRPKSFKAKIDECNLSLSEKLFCELVKQLIENSYKYSDYPSKVVVQGSKVTDGYLMEIIDRGIGLNNTELAQLDTFIQYERDRRTLSGLGIGLNIVKQILNYYNIELHIESEKGKGSNFSFTIPKEYIV